jgi:hypothetical protein
MPRFFKLESNELRICLFFSYAPDTTGDTPSLQWEVEVRKVCGTCVEGVCLAGGTLATMRLSRRWGARI